MYPSIEEIKKFKEFSLIPVCEKYASDMITPIKAMNNLRAISKKHYLLESVGSSTWCRYSFLGFDPLLEIKVKDYKIKITGLINNEYVSKDPLKEIRELMKKYQSPYISNMPSFTGGLIGYAAYDSVMYANESLKLKANDNEKFDDYHFMLFDKVIAFDHYEQMIYFIININALNIDEEYIKANEKIKELKEIVFSNKEYKQKENTLIEPVKANDTIESYTEKINGIKQHIIDGDIFQCVFSRRFKGKMKGNLFDTYRVLRTTNPSPYMIYMNMGDIEIASSSPETLVKLDNGNLQTFPIAGTRPRGKNDKEDILLEKELLNDEKELAEHNMLVDLGRNDIGKVSKFNSVEVVKYQYVQRFSSVMHITSSVSGKIREDQDAFDALKAILPAGTLSGAPKIRACQIIDELETERRGIYGGAMGYIDFRGNMDMCIVIRTAIKRNNDIFVQAGGGIVYDSNPITEYEETNNKAKAILKAINISLGGIK